MDKWVGRIIKGFLAVTAILFWIESATGTPGWLVVEFHDLGKAPTDTILRIALAILGFVLLLIVIGPWRLREWLVRSPSLPPASSLPEPPEPPAPPAASLEPEPPVAEQELPPPAPSRRVAILNYGKRTTMLGNIIGGDWDAGIEDHGEDSIQAMNIFPDPAGGSGDSDKGKRKRNQSKRARKRNRKKKN